MNRDVTHCVWRRLFCYFVLIFFFTFLLGSSSFELMKNELNTVAHFSHEIKKSEKKWLNTAANKLNRVQDRDIWTERHRIGKANRIKMNRNYKPKAMNCCGKYITDIDHTRHKTILFSLKKKTKKQIKMLYRYRSDTQHTKKKWYYFFTSVRIDKKIIIILVWIFVILVLAFYQRHVVFEDIFLSGGWSSCVTGFYCCLAGGCGWMRPWLAHLFLFGGHF